MSFKDILSPFYVWKRAFEKPYTTKKPLKERPGAFRYRGFHQNDMQKCIGCGSCEEICQNAAIDMVMVKGIETTKEDSGLRPQIDYGRCCWCALCIDICTTDSLKMSNQYIWVDKDPDVFRFIPGAVEKAWDEDEQGYVCSENLNLLIPNRIKMPHVGTEESLKSFIEVVKGYSKEQAIREAERCVECGICVASCPAHMDIPAYISAIREDDLEKALEILYETNPMPATCGRICTHRCEDVCSIGVKGEPLAIRWLKRYIIDQFDHKEMQKLLVNDNEENKQKVAIIGAGPGGLSAAYYLVTAGYSVTIFERSSHGGGMVRYGVPEYRMPYKDLDKDIAYIESLGVIFKYKTKIGKDIKFQELEESYDAIFFSTGLPVPYDLSLEGADLKGVIDGLHLLKEITQGQKLELGERVIVIGGGNTAMDAARTARRLGAHVEILYRRRIQDMPADDEEIVDARAENIKFTEKAIPHKIEKAENNKLNFTWNKAKMIDQGEGKRPKPVAIEGDLRTNTADTIITAIGQGADFSFLPKSISDKLKFKKYRLITDNFGQTSVPKIFAGGDIANNVADAISAIADGHKAAKGIHLFLTKKN